MRHTPNVEPDQQTADALRARAGKFRNIEQVARYITYWSAIEGVVTTALDSSSRGPWLGLGIIAAVGGGIYDHRAAEYERMAEAYQPDTNAGR